VTEKRTGTPGLVRAEITCLELGLTRPLRLKDSGGAFCTGVDVETGVDVGVAVDSACGVLVGVELATGELVEVGVGFPELIGCFA